MHTVVCVKQVPETSNVQMDEKTGTVRREGIESIINPWTCMRLRWPSGSRNSMVDTSQSSPWVPGLRRRP